jgi:hypothetical protein
VRQLNPSQIEIVEGGAMTITKMLACWLSFALLFTPVGCAQDGGSTAPSAKKKELPDAPKPNIDPAIFELPAMNYRGPMPSRGYYKHGDDILPRFGFRQVADQRYWTLGVVLPAAASALDAVTTLRAVSLGHPEANPVLGSSPGPGRVAGIKLGIVALFATGSFFMKRSAMQDDYKGIKREGFPGRWWVMSVIGSALWIGVGAHNATLGRVPSQMQSN